MAEIIETIQNLGQIAVPLIEEDLQYPLDLAAVMMLTGQDTLVARPRNNQPRWKISFEEGCR